MKLVALLTLIPDAVIDQRYATTNNVTGTVLYDNIVPQLQVDAAAQFMQAAALFRAHDLRVVIWDGYRPPEVQQKLRAVNAAYDVEYILEDSNHCKGLAIDLTLARTDGTYLDMGTGFDEFNARSHAHATDITPDQAANRQLLRSVMEQCGFSQWPYEWWHYDYLT